MIVPFNTNPVHAECVFIPDSLAVDGHFG